MISRLLALAAPLLLQAHIAWCQTSNNAVSNPEQLADVISACETRFKTLLTKKTAHNDLRSNLRLLSNKNEVIIPLEREQVTAAVLRRHPVRLGAEDLIASQPISVTLVRKLKAHEQGGIDTLIPGQEVLAGEKYRSNCVQSETPLEYKPRARCLYPLDLQFSSSEQNAYRIRLSLLRLLYEALKTKPTPPSLIEMIDPPEFTVSANVLHSLPVGWNQYSIDVMSSFDESTGKNEAAPVRYFKENQYLSTFLTTTGPSKKNEFSIVTREPAQAAPGWRTFSDFLSTGSGKHLVITCTAKAGTLKKLKASADGAKTRPGGMVDKFIVAPIDFVVVLGSKTIVSSNEWLLPPYEKPKPKNSLKQDNSLESGPKEPRRTRAGELLLSTPDIDFGSRYSQSFKVFSNSEQFAASDPDGARIGTTLEFDDDGNNFEIDVAVGYSFQKSSECFNASPWSPKGEKCRDVRGSRRTYTPFVQYRQRQGEFQAIGPDTVENPDGSFSNTVTERFVNGILSSGLRAEYELQDLFSPVSRDRASASSGIDRFSSEGRRRESIRAAFETFYFTDNNFDQEGLQFEFEFAPGYPVNLLPGYRKPIYISLGEIDGRKRDTGFTLEWDLSGVVDYINYFTPPLDRSIGAETGARLDLDTLARIGYDFDLNFKTRRPFARYGDRETWQLTYQRQQRFDFSIEEQSAFLNEINFEVRNIFESIFNIGVVYRQGQDLTNFAEIESLALSFGLEIN